MRTLNGTALELEQHKPFSLVWPDVYHPTHETIAIGMVRDLASSSRI